MTTSADIHAAPKGAVYICAHSEQVKYLKSTYMRPDLNFVTLDWLLGQSWRGMRIPAIVIDPYAERHMTLEHRQAAALVRSLSGLLTAPHQRA